MTKPILDIQHISKSFHSKTTGNNYVLKDFNLTIPTNKITALIGGNGTGKTTLFNIISRLVPADKTITKKILFQGKNLLKQQPNNLASLGIGRLFQDAHIFPNLSILDNMCVASDTSFGENPFDSLLFTKKSKKTEKTKTAKAIQILSDLFTNESIFVQNPNLLAGKLSYGQQRLLGLARLSMGNYSLILLDEPTAGVHTQLNDKIAEIVVLLKKQGKTIFLIEHNMAFVRKIADYVAFMANHNIFIQGEPNDVLNNKQVQQHYLGIL